MLKKNPVFYRNFLKNRNSHKIKRERVGKFLHTSPCSSRTKTRKESDHSLLSLFILAVSLTIVVITYWDLHPYSSLGFKHTLKSMSNLRIHDHRSRVTVLLHLNCFAMERLSSKSHLHLLFWFDKSEQV